MKTNSCTLLWAAFLAAALGATEFSLGQVSPYRGLWVGTASLRYVNEVAIPLDANNHPVAPDPRVPTAAFDEATVRIILHVNGAGQVCLLKDVAILNRKEPASDGSPEVFADETDLALVTDPRVYASYPPQPAKRIASAVFDFGDAEATRALDALVAQAAQSATNFALRPGLDLSTQALRVQARQDASASIASALSPVAVNADVAESYSRFLALFTSAKVDAIAADTNSSEVAASLNLATQLRDQSFYRDSRAIDLVKAVVAAAACAAPADRETAAENAASAYADVQNLYQRFISGKTFGDMILASATGAVTAAKVPGATAASIETALRAIPATAKAIAEAPNAKAPMYRDTRSTTAISVVLAAMAQAAFAGAALPESDIRQASERAGRAALAELVARYPLPARTPTADYNAFVKSAAFAGAVQKAAEAAAQGAVDERGTNPLYSELSVFSAAKVAAVNALRTEYAAAARAQRTELPLEGVFGPGSGDPRLVSELAQPSDLGPAGLLGRLYLPASYPTNPFRHRRHPDHTVGFDIERSIRFDFDGSAGDALQAAGYGVDQITGTYREEVFGLHKPLGPDPVSSPVGLKTEGRFQLNRISFIDTLNTL